MKNLGQRTLVTIIIIPLAFLVIYFGGYLYDAVIILLLCIAAWENGRLLEKIDLKPATRIVIAAVMVLGVARALVQFNASSVLLTVMLFGLSAWHMLQYEREDSVPAADFGASVSILMYIGFLGSYLLSLRGLPNGMWWTFLALPTVWIADSGAYFVGSMIGKNKIAPKTSPNKTWEGYFAGVITGVLGSFGLTILYNNVFDAGLPISPIQGALLGLVISLFITLGDLIESMIKRSAGEKDSGTLLPGHGGIFDRLDSLFWAAPIAYYLILHLFL